MLFMHTWLRGFIYIYIVTVIHIIQYLVIVNSCQLRLRTFDINVSVTTMTTFPWQPGTTWPHPFPITSANYIKRVQELSYMTWWFGGHTISTSGQSNWHLLSSSRLLYVILTDIQWILVCQRKVWRKLWLSLQSMMRRPSSLCCSQRHTAY